MTLTPTLKFLLAVSFQVILLLIVILLKVSVANSGTEVFLRIAPVDPRDPLRGDYITFQYDISFLGSYRFSKKPTDGQQIYVPLKKQGRFWIADQPISTQKPKDASKLFIKARVKSGGESPETMIKDLKSLRTPLQDSIQVIYGIEEFFIPEGSGRTLPTGVTNETAAKVLIDNNGNAVLKQVYVNGKPWP